MMQKKIKQDAKEMQKIREELKDAYFKNAQLENKLTEMTPSHIIHIYLHIPIYHLFHDPIH